MNNLAAFRKKLEEGQLCVGIGIFRSDPAVSELVGEAGYDFTFFDMEHGPHTLESATNHLHALCGGNTAALIDPNDLSGSMNRLGQTGDPELNEIIDDVARRVKAAGKYLGTATGGSEENVRRWVGRGVDFISTEDDFVNLYSSSLDLLNNVRRFATQ